MCKKIMAIFFLLFLIYAPAQAADNVAINEVAWMGTTVGSSDEWIEIYNPTDQEIDLTDWTLSWDGGDVLLSGVIPASGYFLLERTDDESVPEITADQIYSGSLGNSGENLVLKNNLGETIDTAMFSAGWPAGDNTEKFTMERKCELGGGDIAESWQNSLEANGTPKLANNCEVTSPACEYTEWTDQNCVENMRQQTREELTGYDYCTEELSREIEDDTCEVVSNEINITGRGCWLDNYRWKCDRNSELIVSDENITVNIPKKDITQTFAVVNKKEFRSLTIYKAKAGGKHYTLVINNKTNIVVGFGFGLHFRGGVVE